MLPRIISLFRDWCYFISFLWLFTIYYYWDCRNIYSNANILLMKGNKHLLKTYLSLKGSAFIYSTSNMILLASEKSLCVEWDAWQQVSLWLKLNPSSHCQITHLALVLLPRVCTWGLDVFFFFLTSLNLTIKENIRSILTHRLVMWGDWELPVPGSVNASWQFAIWCYAKFNGLYHSESTLWSWPIGCELECLKFSLSQSWHCLLVDGKVVLNSLSEELNSGNWLTSQNHTSQWMLKRKYEVKCPPMRAIWLFTGMWKCWFI